MDDIPILDIVEVVLVDVKIVSSELKEFADLEHAQIKYLYYGVARLLSLPVKLLAGLLAGH
jgi:hypothetical protein